MSAPPAAPPRANMGTAVSKRKTLRNEAMSSVAAKVRWVPGGERAGPAVPGTLPAPGRVGAPSCGEGPPPLSPSGPAEAAGTTPGIVPRGRSAGPPGQDAVPPGLGNGRASEGPRFVPLARCRGAPRAAGWWLWATALPPHAADPRPWERQFVSRGVPAARCRPGEHHPQVLFAGLARSRSGVDL